MGRLSDRINASNAEFKKMLDMPLHQKIEYIRLQGIAEDLKLEREKPKQSIIMNLLQSPIIDPFEVTTEQSSLASDRAHQLYQKQIDNKGLSDSDKEKERIFRNISSTTTSKRWAARGNFDPHWSEVAARAIAQLQRLGFRDNADVQRYLDHGEMPDVSG